LLGLGQNAQRGWRRIALGILIVREGRLFQDVSISGTKVRLEGTRDLQAVGTRLKVEVYGNCSEPRTRRKTCSRSLLSFFEAPIISCDPLQAVVWVLRRLTFREGSYGDLIEPQRCADSNPTNPTALKWLTSNAHTCNFTCMS